MQSTETRAMIESGLLTGIVTILSILAINVPFLSVLGTIVAPATLVVLCVRQGIKWGFLSWLATCVVLSFFIGPFMMAVEAVYLFGGFLLGLSYQMQFKGTRVVLLPTVILFVLFIGSLFVGAMVMGTDIHGLWEMARTSFLQTMEQMYAGQSEEQLAMVMKNGNDLFNTAKYVIVSMLFISTGLVICMVGAVAEFILQRLGTPVATPMAGVSQWRFPQEVLYLLALGYAANYWGLSRQIDWLIYVGQNFTFIGFFLICLQGIGFFWLVGRRYRISSFLRSLGVLLIFMMPIIGVGLGLLDMLTTVRERLFR